MHFLVPTKYPTAHPYGRNPETLARLPFFKYFKEILGIHTPEFSWVIASPGFLGTFREFHIFFHAFIHNGY